MATAHDFELIADAVYRVNPHEDRPPLMVGETYVILAYAGTNPADRADILADAQSVVGGRSGVGTQVDEAQQFASRVQAHYPVASMETVGHSLGGYLAYVAAENHWP